MFAAAVLVILTTFDTDDNVDRALAAGAKVMPSIEEPRLYGAHSSIAGRADKPPRRITAT